MKKITYLESAEEIIKAFTSVRREHDDFPYVGNTARVIVMNPNGDLKLEFNDISRDDIQIRNVEWSELRDAMADKLGIDLVFHPSYNNSK